MTILTSTAFRVAALIREEAFIKSKCLVQYGYPKLQRMNQKVNQGQMVHFAGIQSNVKRLANLVARMKNACVEVTHVIRTMTKEIVVMNLYQMVL